MRFNKFVKKRNHQVETGTITDFSLGGWKFILRAMPRDWITRMILKSAQPDEIASLGFDPRPWIAHEIDPVAYPCSRALTVKAHQALLSGESADILYEIQRRSHAELLRLVVVECVDFPREFEHAHSHLRPFGKFAGLIVPDEVRLAALTFACKLRR